MNIIIGYFGKFLWYKRNSAEEFITSLPYPKVELPVAYLKNELLKPLRNQPDVYVIFGMRDDIQSPQFEVKAKNEKITAKNKFFRFFLGVYVWWLWLFKKNLTLKKAPKKEQVQVISISKHTKTFVSLREKIPKEFTVSRDAGYFICNYAVWVIGEYIKRKRLKTQFYFIHLPEKLLKEDEKKLKKWLESISK